MLDPIVPSDLLRAGKLFKRTTGLGADLFHPRWVLLLSAGLLAFLCDILNAIEKLGVWPDLLDHLHVAFLPKPQGGVRPIVLFCGLYRLWARARLPVVRTWELEHCSRDYWWGGVGRSAEHCMWWHAVLDEYADCSGVESATVAADLSSTKGSATSAW